MGELVITPENRPEMARFDVEVEPERTWPPGPGMLMIRRFSKLNDKQEFELIKTDLHFFTKVREPGQEWESQSIAEVDFSGAVRPAQLQHSTWTETATQRAVMKDDRTRIEHYRATDEDLVQIFAGVLQSYKVYGERAETIFERWTIQIYKHPALQRHEKPRVQNAVKAALTKA